MKNRILFLVFGVVLMLTIIQNVSAVWTNDLNTNLTDYWTMNMANATGNATFNNVTNEYDRIIFGASNTAFVTGLQNNALNFTNNVGFSTSNKTFNYNVSFTENFWINGVYSNDAQNFIWHTGTTETGTGDNMELLIRGNGTVLFTAAFATYGYAGTNKTITNSSWHMITIQNDGVGVGTFRVWVDGALAYVQTRTETTDLTALYDRIKSPLTVVVPNYVAADEIARWNGTLTQTQINALYNSGTGITWAASVFTPIITLNSPIDAYNTTNMTTNFNGTVTQQTNPIANVSLIIDGIYNQTNSSGISGVNYLFLNKVLPVGLHNWTYESCDTADACSNATIRNITITSIITNSINYNPFTYETKSEIFYTNITTNGSTLTSPLLIYNGTAHTATAILLEGSNYNLSATIDVPSGVQNNTVYFNVTIGGVQASGTSRNQSVSALTLSNCNSPVYFLNLTFLDELNQTQINESITSSTFNYWLGNGGTFKTLSYLNSSTNQNYFFCLNLVNQTIHSNVTISYDLPGSYPTRTYLNTSMTLSNQTTNLSLYSLFISSGQLVTFQIVNPATQPLLGVFGNATKVIGSTTAIIGSGTSGADGGLSFFVSPLATYTFMFSLSGYDTFTLTTAPTQTSYTITLGGAGTNTTDYTRGVTQTISPQLNILDNGTFYLVNYTIRSDYWNLNYFNFTLTGQNGTLIASNSSMTASGGTLTANISTLNYTSITLDYFYYINGNLVNSSVTWKISGISGNGYSILNLFTDLATYLSGGMFGSDSFAIGVIIFIVIFVSVGMVGSKFGFTSPASIISILTGLVIFFDVGLGMDTYMNPAVGAIPYFPSVLMLIVAVGFILRETSR